MKPASLASSFGLKLTQDGSCARLSRRGATATLDFVPRLATAQERFEAWVTFAGVRLGLDLAEGGETDRGDAVQRLLPTAVVRLAEAVAGTEIGAQPWLGQRSLSVIAIREHGRLTVPCTTSEDARRALFYEAYKLRPTVETFGAGRVLTWSAAGGLASSIATLFVDYDLDSASGHGAMVVVDRDQLIVCRQDDEQIPGASFRALARETSESSRLPFSRRIYQLSRNGVTVRETFGAGGDFASPPPAGTLRGVEYVD